PGGPPADLVLVQPGQAFAGLEGLLDGPPSSGDGDQGAQRDRVGAVAAEVGQLAGAPVAAGQQPVAAAVAGGGEVDQRPVVLALALGPGSAGIPPPCPCEHPSGQCVGAEDARGGGQPVR